MKPIKALLVPLSESQQRRAKLIRKPWSRADVVREKNRREEIKRIVQEWKEKNK
jgi:hypothetical protein